MKGQGYIIENGFIVGTHTCQRSPENPDEFLCPPNYVEIDNVPSCNSDELITYDEVSKTCTVIKNYNCKTVYSKANSKIQKTNVGIELEEGYTDINPPDNFIMYVYETSWIPDRDDLIAKALEKNLNNYAIVYSVSDNEYLKYQKRQQAGILTEQDEADIQQAITAYAEATALYRTMKDAIDSMTITELQHYMEA